MKYDDIEKKLSLFALKEADGNLKGKVLEQARNAWTAKQRSPVFTFGLIRNYAYALAILILISITSSKIDISLTDKLIDGKTISFAKTIEKSNGIGNLCVDLGIDCKTYTLLANIVKTEKYEIKPTGFEQLEQLNKELNLINGGLS
ncbi:MAG: hypothetical protein PHW62_06285 [Candidatus Ratteibacteria bacterium]|nr:hypothetical protein [Candidatus Ratteibacteria bacterium]